MDKHKDINIIENEQNGFADMGLPPLLVKNLHKMGVSEPKPIQSKTIAPLLQGCDILAIAQTGSGKTFAFSLPILTKIIGLGAKRKPKTAAALILTPTRELAAQIESAILSAAKNMHLRIGLVLGGVSRLRQMKQMAGGVDVLIATPGRLMDHVRSNNIDLSQTSFFVLDEADRMLDMGFIGDVRAIAARLAMPRQTALFSATMPKEVAGLAESLLVNPLRVETAPQGTVVSAIKETIYAVRQADKKKVLPLLLAQEEFRSVIVFTRTKHGADAVERFLHKAGCSAKVIHGNKSQNARQRALDSFRRGDSAVLIATDIAARGIDVPGVSHVINYEFPAEAESYVHRIGRTGRNGAAGEAITLYDSSVEASRLRAVERLTSKKISVRALPVLEKGSFSGNKKAAAGKNLAEMPENNKRDAANNDKKYGKKRKDRNSRSGNIRNDSFGDSFGEGGIRAGERIRKTGRNKRVSDFAESMEMRSPVAGFSDKENGERAGRGRAAGLAERQGRERRSRAKNSSKPAKSFQRRGNAGEFGAEGDVTQTRGRPPARQSKRKQGYSDIARAAKGRKYSMREK